MSRKPWWEAGRAISLRTALMLGLVLAAFTPAMAQSGYVVQWTWPDGTQFEQYAWTSAKGVAAVFTQGPAGTYTVTVVNIVLSGHTFDPSHSILTRSITVGN